MAKILVHRKYGELTRRKDLSANTLASFLVTQGVRSVPELTCDRVMSAEVLRFLNLDRALEHWTAEGRLALVPSGYVLAEAGLQEAEEREAGVARKVNGDKKAENVNPELVRIARQFILHGDGGQHKTATFDLPEQPS